MKNIVKKYIQVGSYLEGLIETNTIVQSKFEFDARLKNKSIFKILRLVDDSNARNSMRKMRDAMLMRG